MKDFTSKGISLENMVGETPGKEKGMTGKTSPKTNQTVALTEDLKWELRTFASDHRCRGVKTLLETMIECFVRELRRAEGVCAGNRDKLERFWREYVKK